MGITRNAKKGQGSGNDEQAWFHIMNRGVARRTVIEDDRDGAEFIASMQAVVEKGLLEIHAYCLMSTHFHMLVRSSSRSLPQAMQLGLNRYSRWFNRTRRRDGPLWRGRYRSKIVESEAYWNLLVRYIDHNPVQAGMVQNPAEFGLGSAYHYTCEPAGPSWLNRNVVESAACEITGSAKYTPSAYLRAFGAQPEKAAHWMIETHGFSKHHPAGAYTELVGGAPDRVKAWMERKAQLADGSPIVGVGIIAPGDLLDLVHWRKSEHPDWQVRPRKRNKPGWRALASSLLYMVSGCSQDEVAKFTGLAPTTVGRHVSEHAQLMASDEIYAARCTEVVSALLGSGGAWRSSPA